VKILATMVYLKYLLTWSGRVQFFIDNLRMSFLEIERIEVGKFLLFSWHNNVYGIISLMLKMFRF